MKLRDYKKNQIVVASAAIEAAVFTPTGRHDYGNTIYKATIYLKSGSTIEAELNDSDKSDIEKLLG